MFGLFSFRSLFRITSALMVCSLSACSLFYTPGMSQLRELCEKDGGMPVYQEIKAKGYLNKWEKSCSCWTYLTHDGFEFMEFDIPVARPMDQLPEAGLWRISKIPRESAQCSPRYEERLSRKKGRDDYNSFLKTSCIKAEKIHELKSQYAYDSDAESWKVSDYYGSTLDRIETTLTDIESGEIVVTRVNYLLNPFPESSLAYGVVYSCLDVLDAPYFRKVITPNN